MSDEQHGMDPGVALGEARRIEAEVQRKGRWHGWVWLTIGLMSPAFLIGVKAEGVSPEVQFWGVIGFMVVAATLAVWETRRGLWGREAASIDRRATWTYMAAMGAVALLAITFDPVGPPAWYVVAAIVPAIPCLRAAWRILR